MRATITGIIAAVFLLFHSSHTHALLNDDLEDQPSKTIVKAVIVPKAAEVGAWIGEGWGFYITEWIITRANASKPGLIRKVRSLGASGNLLDEWAPTGRKIGSYVGYLMAGCSVMFLIDRYFSPWKRFLTSAALGEFNFTRLKQGDSSKLLESSFVGIGIGCFIYFDLKPKR